MSESEKYRKYEVVGEMVANSVAERVFGEMPDLHAWDKGASIQLLDANGNVVFKWSRAVFREVIMNAVRPSLRYTVSGGEETTEGDE